MSKRNFFPVLAILFCAVPAAAQNHDPGRFGNGSISWDFMRPMLEDDEGISVLVGSVLRARVPIGGIHLVAEVPFAFADDDFESSQALGNILLGLERAAGKVTLSGGLRIATAPEDEIASFVGFMSDYLRPEAWASNLWSVNGGLRVHDRGASGVGYNVVLGATMLIPDQSDIGNEILLDYGAHLSWRPRAVGITGGVNGRAFVTGDDGSLSDRTIHDVQVRLDYTKGRWRPGVEFRMPLDKDMRESIHGVVRLGMEYAIN